MKKSQLKQIIKEEIQKVLDKQQAFYSDDSQIAPGFIKQTKYNKPVGNILFKINKLPTEITPSQNQQIQEKIFVKHFGKMDPDYSKSFFTNKNKWSTVFPSKNYNFEYTITFNNNGDIDIEETKSTPIDQPQSNNPDTIVLPFNIYYVNSSSETRNVGLDDGVVTEPELMTTLWSEYQNMQSFERTTKSGGDKYTNMMQDMGLGTDSEVDADKMFFGETMQNLLNNIELYVPEGSVGEKENEIEDPYNNFIYGIYYDEEGNDFKYSKQEADKYKYELVNDDEFKEFVETIKTALL